jgi:hypothetical protein
MPTKTFARAPLVADAVIALIRSSEDSRRAQDMFKLLYALLKLGQTLIAFLLVISRGVV